MNSQSHIDVVKNEFSTQARQVWAGGVPDHLREMVSRLHLSKNDVVIDVAAGSCRVSRAMAPFVKSVTAVDVTREMLEQGKKTALQERLTNINFQAGCAENLEFDDETFDVAITRYSFHHLIDMKLVLREMVRVVREGGRVIVIDILSPEDKDLADAYNYYQTMRDPSHVCSPSLDELKAWCEEFNLRIASCLPEENTQDLEDWMSLPSMKDNAREQIRAAVCEDLAGQRKTGLRPFVDTGKIKFREVVATVVGQKER